MNGRDCEEVLQAYLDGEPHSSAQEEFDRHLGACPACRELQGAVQRLRQGLRWSAPPVPPAGLAGEISARLLAEISKQNRRRRATVGLALAASLLVVAISVYYLPFSRQRAGRPEELRVENPPNLASPSLQRSVQEAGLAVFSLTRRAADETLDQGRLLLPVVVPAKALSEAPESPQVQRLPDRSLIDAKDGVAAGLEPVATSARRAMNLFLREIPPMGTERKEGL
jgi:hypothetical protein